MKFEAYRDIVIVVDSRERLPYEFTQPTVVGTLDTGDYSIQGLEDRVAIERKSTGDLIGSMTGKNRPRFLKEMRRSRMLDYFAVVVEGNVSDILEGNYFSAAAPEAMLQSVLAIAVRYKVPFFFCGNRETAERITQDLLVRYAKEICNRYADLARIAA